ncbi:hypothetical protein EHF33_13595 [Deinococcus psychrotolerans]|uniref:Transglutaminase-like domain-containing protein n=1 Tax=Deinococcus psychrotolerans TaxID=2489213 RepID=A0A3G8YFB7_9DEIO|nr:hypothetical protein [Deinococcus psychrotolerans]AZI43655.1 hypothetical protein EHF33_13595 [Deinococcus psychrotolerans]
MLNSHAPSLAQQLNEQLREAAVQRGILPTDAPTPTPEVAFALVRDMPYARASTHEPAGIIGEWRGTCSTKHELLAALLAEHGLESAIIACTQEIKLPDDADPDLRALSGGQSVVDIHNYLVVNTPQGQMKVDATWPLRAAEVGLPVNAAWQWGEDMTLACIPLESWTVPDSETVSGFKDRLLAERYSPEELERRDHFIRKVGELFLR